MKLYVNRASYASCQSTEMAGLHRRSLKSADASQRAACWSHFVPLLQQSWPGVSHSWDTAGAAVGQQRGVWLFHHVRQSQIWNDNFYIYRYLPVLLSSICAILKSFDVNFQFGTNRNDSLKWKGKNNPSTPISGDSTFRSTSWTIELVWVYPYPQVQPESVLVELGCASNNWQPSVDTQQKMPDGPSSEYSVLEHKALICGMYALKMLSRATDAPKEPCKEVQGNQNPTTC